MHADPQDCDIGGTANKLDPRAKLVMVLCLYAGACAADGTWRLGIVLAAAASWSLSVSPGGRARAGTAAAMVLGSVSLLCMHYCRQWPAAVAEPAARACIILLGGRAFSRSTAMGELAAALQQARCPRSLLLVLLISQVAVGCVRQEISQAWDAARARASCLGTSCSPVSLAAMAWWATVSFCARLLRRADAMAAAVELRGFSRPGVRTSLRRPRLRLVDWCVATACCVAAALLLRTH